MNIEPVQLDRYISLVVEESLDLDMVKTWYATVTEKAPYGVVSTIPMVDDKGQPQSVRLVHRKMKRGHFYMVPITRDLTEGEVERIVDAFTDEAPDLDFDIEATVIPTQLSKPDRPSIPVDHQKYADVAMSWAKKQHEDWLKARTDSGWRYGQVVSLAQKTHPLLRPWDELPARYKSVDLDGPQKLLDLLGQHGYVVVSKDDLDAVLRLMRQL
jgi:hypothetical protein